MALTLKAARVNAGLTQAAAAKIIGVSEQTLVKYEKGTAYPNVRTLKRIEDAYKVEYRDLVFYGI